MMSTFILDFVIFHFGVFFGFPCNMISSISSRRLRPEQESYQKALLLNSCLKSKSLARVSTTGSSWPNYSEFMRDSESALQYGHKVTGPVMENSAAQLNSSKAPFYEWIRLFASDTGWGDCRWGFLIFSKTMRSGLKIEIGRKLLLIQIYLFGLNSKFFELKAMEKTTLTLGVGKLGFARRGGKFLLASSSCDFKA